MAAQGFFGEERTRRDVSALAHCLPGETAWVTDAVPAVPSGGTPG